MTYFIVIAHQISKQAGTTGSSLTNLEQWEIIFAVIVILSLAGGAVYKIWKILSDYTSKEAEKVRLWQAEQDERRHKWQIERDQAFVNAQANQDKKWQEYFTNLQETTAANQDDLKDTLIAIQTALLRLNEGVANIKEAVNVHHEWAKTAANNPILPGRKPRT